GAGGGPGGARPAEQGGRRPRPRDQAEPGPQGLRVAVVGREEPAHDRVAQVQRKRRPDERGGVEVRRDEAQAGPVGEEDGGGHMLPRRQSLIFENASLYFDASRPADTAASRAADTGATRPGERVIVRRLCSLGGEALGTLAATLFASPRFTEAFGRAVQAALEAKGRVDRNVQTVLGLLNLPSRADLSRIATRLDRKSTRLNSS